MVTMVASVGSGLGVSWGAEARDGYCPDCEAMLDEPTAEDKAEYRTTRLLKRMCPKCGERKAGKLIVRQISIEAPTLKCTRIRCILAYEIKSIFYGLLRIHEQYRTAYAVRHRGDNIPEHYRTGENLPTSVRSVLWEIFKLAIRR